MYEFTRNDYAILRSINKRKANTELRSVSIITIQEDTNLSSVKIRSTIKMFLDEGYIGCGIKKVNAKTFYILPKGIEKLNSLIGGEDKTC
jgi:hypothetical protein